MKLINTRGKNFETLFRKITRRGGSYDSRIWMSVQQIVDDVARQGDKALFAYTKKFDGHRLSAGSVEVSPEEWQEAAARVPVGDIRVLKLAATRIKAYHRRQKMPAYEICDEEGIYLGQRVTPLERVGIYAPGGLAIYPSTVLMAAIPAAIAGVGEIILVSPVQDGLLKPLIAAAASIGGVNRMFKVGGAQAIAALAFGTRSIPRVDKIVGPGNVYVATAKKIIFGQTDIDMIAGPSEVLIIADGTGPASFAAADMIAQAEHDEMACALLLTPDAAYAAQVRAEVQRQLKLLPKAAIAGKALKTYGAIVVTSSMDEAVAIANRFAPEHLELMVKNPRQLLDAVRNAGAVFLGHYTPEALGDYTAGTNHILPTGGTARFSSPLGVYDFLKRTSILSFTEKALRKIGRQTAKFADLEGLTGHGHSINVRLDKEKRA